MFDLNKPRWDEMQQMKLDAYQSGNLELAAYWQNEQLSKKLSDIIFKLQERNV